jgi:SAM-dependent methyltransferase
MPAGPGEEGTFATYRQRRVAPGTVGGMQERARSFDAVADLYDELRPRYPDALYDDLLELSGAPARPEVLEVGTGPAVATLPLAERGCRIVGLEPGANLAAVARDRLAPYPDVEIREVTFEAADLPPAAFDLVVSASAWHWVDPKVGTDKAASVLRPGGCLGVWWGHGSLTDTDLLADFRAIHDRWAPEIGAARYGGTAIDEADRIDDWHGRRRRSDIARTLADHPAFDDVTERPHPFESTYDAHTFMRLLDTYSDYRLLDADVRAHLFDDLEQAVDERHGGHVTRRYSPTLFLARRTR